MILTDISIVMNKWLFVVLSGAGVFAITVFLIKISDNKYNKN